MTDSIQKLEKRNELPLSVEVEVSTLSFIDLFLEVLVKSQEVPLQHGHSDLADLTHIPDPRPGRQKHLLVDVLGGGNIDDDGPFLDPRRIHLVLVAGHAQNHNVGFLHSRLDRRVCGRQHELPTGEDVQGVDINAPHFCPIVRQHSSHRPADDLGPIDHHGRLARHALANRKVRVVHLEVLKGLHHCKWRTREHALLGSRRVNGALVPVERPSIEVVQPLCILVRRHGVTQVVVVGSAVEAGPLSEDGVVNHDAIDIRLLVRLL
mmetsp:Transcript_87821/g.209873  ORF Transcript_87821/g.209873 Transcript_87821/m.209873 type:complete len:264 (+) Transcript_87821:243-1034(+)